MTKFINKGNIKYRNPVDGVPCEFVTREDIEKILAVHVTEIRFAFDEKEDTPSLFHYSACDWDCDDTCSGDPIVGENKGSFNFCPNCGAKIIPKKYLT